MINTIYIRNSYFSIILLVLFWMTQAKSSPILITGPRDFINVEMGETIKIKLLLKNISKKTVYLGNQWIHRNTTFFFEEGTCLLDGQSLRANKSCSVYIKFDPFDNEDSIARYTVGYYNYNGTKWFKSSFLLKGRGNYYEEEQY